MPDYLAGHIESFVAPYSNCNVVLSSRYHGILAAAWAGCRVGALAGRSSKVDNLAKQLDIPRLASPYSAAALERLSKTAVVVRRASLQGEAVKAKAAMESLVNWLT
jgi:polysaccharide pyruvyl transferase WcaK-like protein